MKIGLRTRLLLSHIIVMLVGLGTLVIVGKLYSPHFFILHLEQLKGRGFDLDFVRHELIAGFDSAWSRGALWSLIVSGLTAGGLSYLVAKRIMQPLFQIEKVMQKFAQGNINARLPKSEIPELNRLANSFNRMAVNLEGVEQRRRDLVGDLTHELRTPLTVLEGYLEGLADGTISPSVDIFQRLAKETTRLGRLVNDLQDLSKAEAGYLPINTQSVDLYLLLHSLLGKFSEQILDGSIELRLDYAPDLPKVLGDPERLEQILVNLIGNALRYTNEGIVTIHSWKDGGKLWIAVTDTGIGIAATDLPHVFERFWRSDRSRDRNSGGTGIGLAISRRLVELQGGEIKVESELGKGSTFCFSIITDDKTL